MQEKLSHALQIDYRLLNERLKAKTIYSFASKGSCVQNGKFVWTGYLTVRIHDSAKDATSLHAAGLRDLHATAMPEFHWSGGRRSDDLHAASTPSSLCGGAFAFARCFETLKKGLWKLKGRWWKPQSLKFSIGR
jgi:hypothetical protein